MSIRLPRRRIWRAFIYLICLGLVLTAADLLLAQVRRAIRPAYDTTRIISPTLPGGRIDYLKFLDDRRSQGVTPANNAAVPFFEAIGRSALPKTQPPDGITDRLGMPHLPEEGDYLIGLADYFRLHSLPLPPNFGPGDYPTAWPADITPTMRQWIDSNAHPLDLLVEASLRSRFFIPFDGGNRPEMLCEVFLPHVHAFDEIGSILLTRAVMRLQSGDPNGCMADLLAVHRLARLFSQSTLIERMDAQNRLEFPALQVDRLVAGKLSADQSKSLAAQLHELGDLPPIAQYINDERMFVLDMMQEFALAPERFDDVLTGMNNRPTGIPRWFFRFLPVPWESDMRGFNHMYDGALVALDQSPYSRRLSALQLWQQPVDATKANPIYDMLSIAYSPDCFISMLMLSPMNAEHNQDNSIMQKRLSEVALTLAAYKSEHGQYPAALSDLAPAYLTKIPDDLYTERPLIYRPTSAGYTLYSVGPNMIDDGGAPNSSDDIVASVP